MNEMVDKEAVLAAILGFKLAAECDKQLHMLTELEEMIQRL